MEAKPAPQIRARTWTRVDLLRDFQKQPDYFDLKATFVGMVIKKLAGSLSPDAGGVTTLLDQATEFFKNTIQKEAISKVVGYAVQEKLESKAQGKMIRSFGTQFVLASISFAQGVALPAGIPIGALFTFIIYLDEKEKEKQDKWNNELATKLDDVMEDIRKKAQDKLDKQHVKELERFLLANAAEENVDDSEFGSYQNGDEPEVVISIGDAAQIRDNIKANLQNSVSNDDLLKACAAANIKPLPNQTLQLTNEQIKKLNDFVQDGIDASFPGTDEHH